MNKYVILFFLLFQGSFAQEIKLSDEQLKSLKMAYNWNSEDLLIVNFRQPRNNCNYNNYKNLEISKNWVSKNVFTIKNIDTNRIIYIYSDSKLAKRSIDNTESYNDVNDFFTTNFSANGHCYAIIIVNQDGEMVYKVGEYSKEDVISLIDKIK